MNFLEIVTASYEECGISGSPPADVQTASGEAKRVVRWVKESWRQLQLQNLGWKWMRASASVNTVANIDRYTPVTHFALARFRAWYPNSGRIYLTSSGRADETPLFYLNYENFLQRWNTGLIPTGRPEQFTIGVGGEIILGPKPDGVYTMSFDYKKSVQELVLSSDVPECPADFHYAIVYRTMMKYARFESAPEIFEYAQESYAAELQRMGAEQLEPIEWRTEALVE